MEKRKKTKELSEDLRSKIVRKHEQSQGYKSTSKDLNVPVSTVRSVIKKFNLYTPSAVHEDKMPNCIVLGCPHKCGKKDKFPGVIMHAFPRSLDRIKAWLLQTGQMFEDLDGLAQRIYDGKKNSAHRLCSAHFTIDCYIVNKTNRVLRPNALPSIFPPPGFYHGRKRGRKQRKTKDSGQLPSSLHHLLWQQSSGGEAWTEREYFFQGAETETDLSCFDARDRLRSDKGFQHLLCERSRLFEHAMPDAPQSLLAGLKEEQVEYPCAEREYGFSPEPQEIPRLLTAIKTENVDEHPINEHKDDICRIVIDSPTEEVRHLTFPGLEDNINSRCLLEVSMTDSSASIGCFWCGKSCTRLIYPTHAPCVHTPPSTISKTPLTQSSAPPPIICARIYVRQSRDASMNVRRSVCNVPYDPY